MPEPTRHVAIVGGFDADNFGDALFPVLAERALRARLGSALTLTVYGWRDLQAGVRSYDIRDVARLPDELGDVDLVVLGGGQLVRGDPLGPVYSPATPEVHDPLGIWLVPTLTALVAGTPVAWNAPGVSPTIPAALGPLTGAVAALVDHLNVRDEQSARWFADAAGVRPAVVPDSAFGLAVEPSPPPGADARAILDGPLGGRPYAILQPSAWLGPVLPQIHALLERVHAAGLTILELPIGALFGERPGALGPLPVPTVSLSRWTSPEVTADLIAHANAAIGISFHLGVTAVAAGTPLYRPASPPGWKYETLDRLPGVTVLGDGSSPAPPDTAADGPAPETRALGAAVAAHWDRIAELARDGRRARPPERVRALAGNVVEQVLRAL